MKKATLMLCILFFFLHSCQRKKRESVSIPSTELQPLTLGMLPTLDELSFHITRAQGIYGLLGLDLTILSFSSTHDRDATFQFRSVDGTIIGYPSAVTLQAIHHTSLGITLKRDGYLCFVAFRENGINQLQELREKDIAASHNTVIKYATGQLLNGVGISQTKVNKLEIAQLPFRLQMLQYNQVGAPFLPDPAASIAANARRRPLASAQELGIDFITIAFPREAISGKRREIGLLITGYNLGIDYIEMHPREEQKQVSIETDVPENLIGLTILPAYREAKCPSADTLNKIVTWLRTNDRILQTYSEYKNLIDTTFTRINSTAIR